MFDRESASRSETGRDIRQAARNRFAGRTVGRAPGFVQANIFIVPDEAAGEFEAFCRANPSSCPLLAIGRPGRRDLPELGAEIDVATDLPAYLLHSARQLQPLCDLTDVWTRRHVAFAIGCWFGAEAALAAAQIRLRHVELGLQGPLFRTSKPAHAAGRFFGPMVASMRPFRSEDVEAVVRITAGLPRSHGAPIHRGDPAVLGITDCARPDWGEALPIEDGETALYWGCGLTALAALQNAGLEFISHAPGSMLVTDLRETI